MRALPLFLCSLLCLGSAPLPPSAPTRPPTLRLITDSEQRWVPFALTPGNQIRFTADVDGHAAVAVLDTGVTHSAISRDFAAAAGLKLAGTGNAARAIGGSIPFDQAAVRHVTVGGLVRDGGVLSVVTMPANATGAATPIDLLLGQDITGRVAIDIDYANGRFRLIPSGRLPFRGESAPLAIAPSLDLYITETRIGATRQRPVMIDTGDGAGLTLSNEAWSAIGARPAPATTALAYGLAGPLVTELTVLPSVTIGEVTARDVEVRIEPAGGYSRGIGVAGRIGNGLLQHYRVLLDPMAGRAVFAAATEAARPPVHSTSGVQAIAEPGSLRVVHVMRGSPAEAAGWHAGDRICSVDGRPIDADYERSGLAKWTVDAPGRMVTIGLCDGGTRRLTLRRFY